MLLTNGYFFINDAFLYGSLEVENGVFGDFHPGNAPEASLREEPREETSRREATDLQGAYVIPGLVDIHIHGSAGADASDGTEDAIRTMGRYLSGIGVTSFLPTAMTLPEERIYAVTDSVLRTMADPQPGSARPLGIRLEGPFLSKEKKGAQNEEYLHAPDRDMFRRILERAQGRIGILDLAPELPGAMDFIREYKDDCLISLAHTAADYACASEAFEAGAGHLTHLFNAMNPLHHRAPGPIGAAAYHQTVTTEIISDGIHHYPAVVYSAFQLFKGRLCLISDAIRCCGMADGTYDLSGQSVTLFHGKATLADGTIAGAASNLYENMKNAIRFGIPKAEAVLAATRIPADIIGEKKIGRIEKGASADFVICDEDLNRKAVFVGGKC